MNTTFANKEAPVEWEQPSFSDSVMGGLVQEYSTGQVREDESEEIFRTLSRVVAQEQCRTETSLTRKPLTTNQEVAWLKTQKNKLKIPKNKI